MVDIMDAHHHDLVLAITSHVPHLIAYNIVGTAADLETGTEVWSHAIRDTKYRGPYPPRTAR